MKNRYDSLLKRRPQINKKVATTYNVHSGKGRVLEDVLPGKDAAVADCLADLVTLLHFIEKSLQPDGRHIGNNAFLVNSGPGPLNGGEIGRASCRERV